MMATIRQIPLPSNTIGSTSSASATEDAHESFHTPRWDYSIGAIPENDLPNNDDNDDGKNDARISNYGNCITYHAIAHGNTVVGTLSNIPSDNDALISHDPIDGDTATKNTIQWQSPFDDPVVTVASNADGSVIAAATKTHVSLLRGRDGTILATRQIAPDTAHSRNEGSSPGLVFVSRGNKRSMENGDEFHGGDSAVRDVLIILCPVPESDKRGRNATRKNSNVVIISNIDGEHLNSPHMNLVRQAASHMSIDPLSLDGDDASVKCLNGFFVNQHTIRLFIANQCGVISVYDFDGVEKISSLILENLLDHLGMGPKNASHISSMEDAWEWDQNSGLSIDYNGCGHRHAGTHYLLFAAKVNGREETRRKICWVDSLTLALVGCYFVPNDCGNDANSTYLTSLQPIESLLPDKGISAAFAISTAEIHVIQLVVSSEDEDSDRHHFDNYANPMLLFTLKPFNKMRGVRGGDVKGIQLCSPPVDSNNGSKETKCRFRFLIQTKNDDNNACGEFSINDQSNAGMIQYLLATHHFDEAYEYANRDLRREETDDIISSPISKSFVAFCQFRYVLSNGDISSEKNVRAAKECLRRLASGAVTDGDSGVDSMIDAAKFLLSWPKNTVSFHSGKNSSTTSVMVSIHEISLALSAMSFTMKGVVNALNAYNLQRLEEMKAKIDERQTAMKGLRFLTGFDKDKISVDDPYLGISSTADLVNILVSQGAFKSVERFQKSNLGKNIFPDMYASAALKIPMNADPRSYVPWLCDILIPSLSTGNPLLESIRSWCCKAADYFDEKNIVCGLDSSIFLLKAVSKATARLSVVENNAFAHNPKLNTDSKFAVEKPETPRENSSFFSSFDSKISIRSKITRPTVLKADMKAEGADYIFSARKASFSTPLTPESTSSSFFSTISPATNRSVADGDNEIAEYDNVEIKLNQALRLRNARSLGMERDSLTLANYSNEGEQFIVKELVKSVLSQVATKSKKNNIDMVNEIRSYAIDVGAKFDDAVHQYAIELCDTNRNIPHALQKVEILSRWCSSASVRCLIVLKMVQKARASVERPPDLNPLAMQAILWASDSNVKAELEEATRLLAIDSLVRKYCGNGAQEFFRVHEQSHGLRLVQQVCRHIDVPSVLTDALMLCDAFKYVSRVDTCVTIIQRTMLASRMEQGRNGTVNRAEQCASLLQDLYERDAVLAEKVGERVAAFCAETLVDCRKFILNDSFVEEAKSQAILASATACSILSIMQSKTIALRNISGKRHGTPSFLVEVSTLLKEFQKVSMLQSGCGVFLSLEELRTTSACKLVLLDLLKPCIELLATQNYSKDLIDESLRHQLKSVMAMARHWCAILGDTPPRISQLWSSSIGDAASRLARSAGTPASLLLLRASGVLDDKSDHSSYQCIFSVVLSLCSRAFTEARNTNSTPLDGDSSSLLIAMKSIAQASFLLREHILSFSPPSILSPALLLCNLTELMCEVSTRSDLGVGERVEKYMNYMHDSSPKHHANPISATSQSSDSSNHCSKYLHHESISTSPNLHPSWYIGDGLLLRPFEALSLSMSYCKMIMNFESNSPTKAFSATSDCAISASGIFHPLESRGAHTATLRLLSFSASVVLSLSCSVEMIATPLLLNAESILKKNKRVLAERSLGGTESGITSGNIDSQLAISFLVHLPKEAAFKIYQAALPSAMGRRDFNRILTLASIGTYCGIGTYSSGKPLPWNKQRRFIEQCKELSRNSKWWAVLSRHAVSFDPSIFTSSDDSANENLEKYCRDLIWNAAKSHGVEIVMRLSSKFAHAYGLNEFFPQTSLVEFLLSSPKNIDTSRGSNCEGDIRFDLHMTESATRLCLSYLPVINQSKVLRKCLIELERDSLASRDYDRHTLVLTLYSECLGKLVTKKEARVRALEAETLRIQRRFDVLTLLSTTFESYPLEERPEYNKMFEPLPLDPFSPPTKRKMCSVLGFEESDDVFDPLVPLHDILDHNGANSMAGALASLCSMVQLPPGYLHARSLIVRFRKLRESGEELPKVESSVIPVMKKLVSPADKADLAWWCSFQYAAGSVEQLHCLDLAHSNATLASEEIESLNGRVAKEDEIGALDRVKRIDTARAILSDHILVDKVLEQNISSNLVQKVYKSIIRKVQKVSADEENYCPEHFVRELLVEGSLSAALASLDDCDGFTTSHFRSLAILVHDACKSLANRYTHIFVGRVARTLARRWMIHGDDASNGIVDCSMTKTTDLLAKNDYKEKKLNEVVQSDEGEITSDFVMDIAWTSDLEGVNSNGLNNNTHRGGENPGIISSEEPSVLDAMSSLRESSEHICSRVALRIAFLICFAEGYHRNKESIINEFGDENFNCNIMVVKRNATMTRKGRKQTCPKDGCFEGNLALEHARELLGIVFAGQGSTVASTCGFLSDEYSSSDNSFLSGSSNSNVIEDGRSKNKALSFAMRHRALRVASILCPHDVIVRVILEEGYATDICDDHLNKYAFGSFVAMEIEAMGLPLPHSDLVQLSEMHFPSFARTIWRNHGGGSYQGFSGRLHLLLLELCVIDRDSIDWELLILIFKELKRLELPRSMILASECVAKSEALETAKSLNREDVIQCVEDGVNSITRLLVHEVKSNLSSGIEMNVPQCLSSVDRIATVVCSIHNNPLLFVSEFIDLALECAETGQRELCQCFVEGASSISSHLMDPSEYSKALNVIRQYAEGYDYIERNLATMKIVQSNEFICSEAIENFEMAFISHLS